MGKPQKDGRESGCQNNASSGWRRECRSARTRGAVARQNPVEGEAGWASPRRMAGRAAARTTPRAGGAGSAGRIGQEGIPFCIPLGKTRVPFPKTLRKEERMEAHSCGVITLVKMRKSAGGQNGRHNAA